MLFSPHLIWNARLSGLDCCFFICFCLRAYSREYFVKEITVHNAFNYRSKFPHSYSWITASNKKSLPCSSQVFYFVLEHNLKWVLWELKRAHMPSNTRPTKAPGQATVNWTQNISATKEIEQKKPSKAKQTNTKWTNKTTKPKTNKQEKKAPFLVTADLTYKYRIRSLLHT